MNDLIGKYRISEALMAIYKLFWDQFASWYLEIIKPSFGTPIDSKTYNSTLEFFERQLLLLHPFMPFITEELWQNVRTRHSNESIMTQSILNLAGTFNENILNNFETCQKIVSEVRNIRTQKNITFKEKLTLEAVDTNPVGNLNPIILKMANLEEIKVVKTKSVGALSFMLGTSEFAVCLGNLADIESELAKLKADLAHLEKFLLGVTRKLENKNFVANAPQAVVENERKKMADTCSKIATIKENIRSLKI